MFVSHFVLKKIKSQSVVWKKEHWGFFQFCEVVINYATGCSVTVHNSEALTGGFIPTSFQIKGSI